MSDESKIVELDSMRPHLVISTPDGKAHVIPVSVFEKVASGEILITNMDDWAMITRVIVCEWLNERLGEWSD